MKELMKELIKLKENFNFNVLNEVLIPKMDAHIEDRDNAIGSSEISMCARATIIRKLHHIALFLSNKMLFGEMYESILKQPLILKELLYYLHSKFEIAKPLDPKLTYDTICNKEDYWDIGEGMFIRLHPDIYTNLYTIEVKTTWMFQRDFTVEKTTADSLLPYQVAQENMYMRFYNQPIGFLHKINGRVFYNKISNDLDAYWNVAWLKYCYFMPIYFDEALFNVSLQRAKYILGKCFDKEFKDVVGPEYAWECNYCDERVRNHCKVPISKIQLDVYETCTSCGRKINKGEYCLYRLDQPYCQQCEAVVREVIE
jgi:hypothetical protein